MNPVQFDFPQDVQTVQTNTNMANMQHCLKEHWIGMIQCHPLALTKGVSAVPFVCDSNFLDCMNVPLVSNMAQILESGTAVAKLIFVPPKNDLSDDCLNKRQGIQTSENIPDALAVTKFLTETKPTLVVFIKGFQFSGLLDSGADVSVIREAEWPPSWQTETSPAVRGVGGVQSAQVSKNWLSATAQGVDGIVQIKPIVLPLHINLWGRDFMSQLGARLILE